MKSLEEQFDLNSSDVIDLVNKKRISLKAFNKETKEEVPIIDIIKKIATDKILKKYENVYELPNYEDGSFYEKMLPIYTNAFNILLIKSVESGFIDEEAFVQLYANKGIQQFTYFCMELGDFLGELLQQIEIKMIEHQLTEEEVEYYKQINEDDKEILKGDK